MRTASKPSSRSPLGKGPCLQRSGQSVLGGTPQLQNIQNGWLSMAEHLCNLYSPLHAMHLFFPIKERMCNYLPMSIHCTTRCHAFTFCQMRRNWLEASCPWILHFLSAASWSPALQRSAHGVHFTGAPRCHNLSISSNGGLICHHGSSQT